MVRHSVRTTSFGKFPSRINQLLVILTLVKHCVVSEQRSDDEQLNTEKRLHVLFISRQIPKKSVQSWRPMQSKNLEIDSIDLHSSVKLVSLIN